MRSLKKKTVFFLKIIRAIWNAYEDMILQTNLQNVVIFESEPVLDIINISFLTFVPHIN